jgi:hypothetical protein
MFFQTIPNEHERKPGSAMDHHQHHGASSTRHPAIDLVVDTACPTSCPLVDSPVHSPPPSHPWGAYPWGAKKDKPKKALKPVLTRAASLPSERVTAQSPPRPRAVSFRETVHYRVIERLPEWASSDQEEEGEEGTKALQADARRCRPGRIFGFRNPEFEERRGEVSMCYARINDLRTLQHAGVLRHGRYCGSREARANARRNRRAASLEGEMVREQIARARFSFGAPQLELAFQVPELEPSSSSESMSASDQDSEVSDALGSDEDADDDDHGSEGDNESVEDSLYGIIIDFAPGDEMDDDGIGFEADDELADDELGGELSIEFEADDETTSGLGEELGGSGSDGFVVPENAAGRNVQAAVWLTTAELDAAASAGEDRLTAAIIERKLEVAEAATEGRADAERTFADAATEIGRAATGARKTSCLGLRRVARSFVAAVRPAPDSSDSSYPPTPSPFSPAPPAESRCPSPLPSAPPSPPPLIAPPPSRVGVYELPPPRPQRRVTALTCLGVQGLSFGSPSRTESLPPL